LAGDQAVNKEVVLMPKVRSLRAIVTRSFDRWVPVRHVAVIVIAGSTLSCTTSQYSAQATLPAPMPPPERAPICARPVEKAAIDVSALLSQLQLITLTCHTRDKYNAVIPHLRPALATKEKNLKAFFARAYGKRGQTEQDKYITELANLQSQFRLASGDRFCSSYSSMLDQVMPLSTIEQLAAYAQSKPVQQVLAVEQCRATPKPPGKGQQTASND
jgi:hypothetical protein